MRSRVMIALVLGAIPAMAFGQSAGCDGCSHQVPVYQGAAGLIATADGADMVNYKAICGNATTTGEIPADDDGIVTLLLGGDLACDDEDATFELGPIMDGGWFWMHVGDNSAVGNLVANDILMNEMTEITDPGDSVEIMDGAGASLLMHTSGRFGILPNILPEVFVELPLCGLRYRGTTPYQLLDDCRLDAEFTMKVTTSDRFGNTVEVGPEITRQAVGDIRLTAKMLVRGHISYRLNAGVVDPEWGAIDSKPLIATWGVYLSNGEPEDTLATFNVAQDSTNFNEFIISPATYCDDPDRSDFSPVIYISAGYVQNFIIPEMPNTSPPTFINKYFTIHCPPPAAQQGVELVPENPFEPTVE